MADYKQYYENKGRYLVRKFQDQLRKKKKIASGKTSNSLRYEVSQRGTQTTLLILAADSIAYIVGGRGRNKRLPNIDAIEEWTEEKNIKPKGKQTKESLAWAIGKSMEKQGVKPTNLKSFLKKEDQNIYEEVRAMMKEDLQQNMMQAFTDELKKSNIQFQVK